MRAVLVLGALGGVLALSAGPVCSQDSTYLYFHSQPGDYIGGGQVFTFTPADGAITAARDPEGWVMVRFKGADLWTLGFAAPQYGPFLPGMYEGATRLFGQSALRPGLAVGGDHRACNRLTGRFVVWQAEFNESGEALQLAVDYEQHCEGAAPALYGSVRFNSSIPQRPTVSVGPATVIEGDEGSVALRFMVSLSVPPPGLVTVHYSTGDGTASGGSDYVPVTGTATFKLETGVPVTVDVLGDTLGESHETLTLSLQGVEGAFMGFDQALGTILNDDPYKTLLYVNSRPGDDVGGGRRFTLTPVDGHFRAEAYDYLVDIFFDGDEDWRVYLAGPEGAALQPGVYENVARFPFQSPTGAGLAVQGGSRGCGEGLVGRLVVREAVYDGAGRVVHLAADFEQRCILFGQVYPPLFGAVRIDSAVPIQPQFSVSPAALYEDDAGTQYMRFVISLSDPLPMNTRVAYQTADGTAQEGSDYTAVAGLVTFPAGATETVVIVPVQGDTFAEADETFTLVLHDPVGAPIGFGQGVGTIRNDDPYKTLLYFNSQPGDYIGQGQRFRLTPIEGRLTARRFGNVVEVFFEGADYWWVDLAAPGSAVLVPGAYAGARRFAGEGRPGLDVHGAHRGCNEVVGRFAVLEVEYGPDDTVTRLAADYEQHCDGSPAALFGSVRVNSTVPLGPRVFAGPAAVGEGSAGFTNLALPVWLSEPQPGPVSVQFFTSDRTATGGVDYVPASGTLSFPRGSLDMAANVLVYGDQLSEADETLTLGLHNGVGTAIGVEKATGTILDDDDIPPLVSIHDVTVIEGAPGAAQANLTVSLNVASGQPVTVDYATEEQSAREGLDFIASSGTVVFEAGITARTVTVAVLGDYAVEPDETLDVVLRAPSGASLGDATGQVTIQDDDQATGYFPVAPCRLLDTRLSGPAVGANASRSFRVVGICGIPATARAMAVVVTAVAPADSGNLRLYPSGLSPPLASVLNFRPGRTQAGNSIVSVGAGGELTVRCDMPLGSTGTTHVVVDVLGYFE